MYNIHLTLAFQPVDVWLVALYKLAIPLSFLRTDLYLGPLLHLISPNYSDLLVFSVSVYCSLYMKAHGQRARGKTSSLSNQFWISIWLVKMNTIPTAWGQLIVQPRMICFNNFFLDDFYFLDWFLEMPCHIWWHFWPGKIQMQHLLPSNIIKFSCTCCVLSSLYLNYISDLEKTNNYF